MSDEKRPYPCADGHDWRVDPFTTLLTNPPRHRLICAACNAWNLGPFTDTPGITRDVQTWPKFEKGSSAPGGTA